MEHTTDSHGKGRNNLLTRPGTTLLEDLGRALAAAAGAFPVPASHRKDLPFAVRDLSRLLTMERAELSRSYWSAPRFLAAYLHYFLPWNLYRLAWLLPGLDLPLRSGSQILDLGSGPLTLPLALWCARPDLRSLPLTFICSDVAVKPMEIGRDILRRLAGDESPWRIILRRDPLEKALARPGKGGEQGNIDCIMAGNMLNELSSARNTPLEQRLEHLTGMAAERLAPAGRLLLVEPGTRLGGKLIALARKGALAHGLSPLAPCTHADSCPMLEQPTHQGPFPPYSGWCHFFHPAGDVPRALADLARHARLEKDSLALSCLLLEKPDSASETLGDPAPATAGNGSRASKASRNVATPMDDLEELEALYAEIMSEDASGPARPSPAKTGRFEQRRREPGRQADDAPGASPSLDLRVISDCIRLPDEAEPGRYACCDRGLALLLDAVRVPSGAFVTVSRPKQEARDAKTGALLLRRSIRK